MPAFALFLPDPAGGGAQLIDQAGAITAGFDFYADQSARLPNGLFVCQNASSSCPIHIWQWNGGTSFTQLATFAGLFSGSPNFPPSTHFAAIGTHFWAAPWIPSNSGEFQFWKFDQTGAVLASIGPTTFLTFGLQCFTPSLDETIAYYSNGVTILRWDLVGNAALSNLASLSADIFGIVKLYPVPGSTDIVAVLIQWDGVSLNNRLLRRYTAAGAIVYDVIVATVLGVADDPYCDAALDPSGTSVWIEYPGPPSYDSSLLCTFAQVSLADGSTLRTITPAGPLTAFGPLTVLGDAIPSGPVAVAGWTLEGELAGPGNGWTDLSGDVRATQPIAWSYGITGNTLTDRVAAPGQLSFALNNSASNSGHLLGYYAADSPNLRAGFDIGIRIRCSIVYGGIRYYKFNGRLSSFDPVPGPYGPRTTLCVVTDWLDEASRTQFLQIPTQVEQRADQVLSVILDAMASPPVSRALGVGADRYVFAPFAPGGVGVLQELQNLAQSEVGYCYMTGDTVAGGRLVFESRAQRQIKSLSAPDAAFEATQLTPGGLTISRTRDAIINHLQVTIHPKRLDGSPTVIFTLRDPTVGPITALQIFPGQTVRLLAPFVNAANPSNPIGATDVITPVAYTDYAVESQPNGGGIDLTGSLTIAMTVGATAASLALTNTSAWVGYVTFLQLRGLGIYDQQQTIWEQTDDASIALYGANVVPYDMPYQSEPAIGILTAAYLVQRAKAQRTTVDAVTILANKSDFLMTQALAREPGDRITIAEPASGLSASSSYFIQACDGQLLPGGILTMRWGLAADRVAGPALWLLGHVGMSELGATTGLGGTAMWRLGTSLLGAETGLGF